MGKSDLFIMRLIHSTWRQELQNAKFFSIKPSETCSKHWDLKFHFAVLWRIRFPKFLNLMLFNDTISVDMGTGSLSRGEEGAKPWRWQPIPF
jgi:hypothetical protein